jgi:chemotaxis family two-component system sensor kinase Cph1
MSQAVAVNPVDLTTCDREPIHIPGLIQPHGCFLLLEPGDGDRHPRIVLASTNTEAVLGVAAESLIGSTLDRVLKQEDAAEVGRRSGLELLHMHPVYIHSARGVACETMFNAVVHRIDRYIALELEPVLPDEHANATHLYRLLQSAMVDLRQTSSVTDICARLARHVRAITGFDRVMVYRFDAEWNGEVIAEEKRQDLEPFFGLHYPAADIPRQARELYTRNWLRFIADRSYDAVQIHPSAKLPGTDTPLDMSHCVLRSVSPIHLEYLKNMSVGASMSISLLKEGRLWGLVACHHYSPRRVGYDVRAACELIGQVVSLQLSDREQGEIAEDLKRGQEGIAQFVSRLSPGPNFVNSLFAEAETLLSLVRCNGVAVVMGTQIARAGQTPSKADIQAIADIVHSANTELFVTDRLSSFLPHMHLAPVASGVLAVPLARTGPQCVLWFRPEQVRVVNWAGDPAKSIVKGEAPARLSPRGSFALWKETVSGSSQPWSSADTAVARELREALVLKLVEQASDLISHNSVLKRASEEKDQTIESERAARTQAERINRLTDEFVATLSHELRTPLNAIQGWVHLLRNGTSGADLAKGLEIIDRNTRAQNQMVNDLLDMSKINTGKLRLDVQPVALPEVLESALSTIQFAAEAKAIRLHKTVDPLQGITVSGDPQRLQQVVWNLLSNAVKFTPKGGMVHVELKRSGSYIELNVRDNGIGIPRDFLPHVFDRFRQADASTTRSYGGLGLGLSIVRHLTEMHGGSISVESQGQGTGAVFTVTLPIRSVTANGSQEPHPVSEVPIGSLANIACLSDLDILVLEDEADARDFVRRLLMDHGARVVAVGSVPDAMVAVNEKEFDLVISDLGMPGEDGYSFIRQLRALEARRSQSRAPCVALTAYARADDRRRVMMAGFQVHVSKPVEPAELIAVAANLTGRLEL